jgi:hypothetical protein
MAMHGMKKKTKSSMKKKKKKPSMNKKMKKSKSIYG